MGKRVLFTFIISIILLFTLSMVYAEQDDVPDEDHYEDDFRGPSDCDSKKSCERYCENHPDECQEFFDGQDRRFEDDYFDDDNEYYDSDDFYDDEEHYDGEHRAGPGGCSNEDECIDYCMQSKEHMRECMRFGPRGDEQGHDTMQEDFRGPDDRQRHDRMPEDFTGPGGCTSKKECMQYCMKPGNMAGCMRFRNEHRDIMDDYDEGYEDEPFHEMDPVDLAMESMFMQTEDMDPYEYLKRHCPNAEALVDDAVQEMKSRGIVLQPHCQAMCEMMGEQCEFMKDVINQCEQVTPVQIHERMVEEAHLMCDMFEAHPGEEGMERIMSEMMDMRDEMPHDMRLKIDEESRKLHKIQEKLEEDKGFIAKLKKFFRIKEKEDAQALQQNRRQLEATITSLLTLSEEVDNPGVQAGLREQIRLLEEEKEKIRNMAEEKEDGTILDSITGSFIMTLTDLRSP